MGNIESMPITPHPNAWVYQADEAELTGGARVEAANKGFTGKGYVAGYFDSSTAATTFRVNVPAAGDYYISLRYSAGAAGNWNADRTVGLSINNGELRKVVFKSISAAWDVWSENIQRVKLEAGINTITYRCLTEDDNSDCINLDKLSVWPYDPNPTITNIVFDKSTYIVSKNYTIQSKIFQVNTNGIQLENNSPVSYSSSDPTVVNVDECTGIIKGIEEGTAIVQAESNGYSAEAGVIVEANPSATVSFASTTRPVDPSMFGYILTPNYDVPNSRMTLLGPLLNRETIPAQNFQAISDLDGSYYIYEDSILQRSLESYLRAKANGLKWYMLLGMSPSWAAPSKGPIDSWKNEPKKSPIEQARFKQYIKDILQYYKDNGAKPDFADLTNEYWTGTEEIFKGNWEALREVFPDFIPAVGPGGVGFAGIPDFYIPYASANKITLEGPAWHEFWVHDHYATFDHLQERKKIIENYQHQYPETNGRYIVWEENNAGSKDPTDWTRSMANVIRTGVTQNIKGCLEPHNANGMSDLLTTNVKQENPAARRPIWWVYYMFSQMSGNYVEISTEGTHEFTAAACMDSEELKIIFAKNDCTGSVDLRLKDQPYAGQDIRVDLYKITTSENNGLEFQYSLDPIPASETNLELSINDINANESWMVVIKKLESLPSFFHPMAPDDGEVVTAAPTLTWSQARDAVSYTLKIAANKDLDNPVIYESGLQATNYTIKKDLEIGQKYYWTVVAENRFGFKPVSNNTVYSFIVGEDINVPGQFGPYLPSVNAPNQSVIPEFQWSTAYNATSYRLVVSKKPDMSDPVINKSSITSVRNTGMYGPNSQVYYQSEITLDYDTRYYWTVYAVNAHGERPMNGPLRFFTTKSEGDEPKEFRLVAPANGETDIPARAVLSWEASKNAFFYKLEISSNGDMSNPLLVRDRMIYNKYTVEPNLLKPNTTYYWRVTAYTKDLLHSVEASDQIRCFITESVPCSPLLYAVKSGDESCVLWFHSSYGARSYKVLYGTSSNNYTEVIDGVLQSPYTVTRLKNGTMYYFAVVAVNEEGNSSIWNERSAVPMANPDKKG
ncbi:MAG: carbohydrate-binding protein [Firmicutes bacterium]|nr:carbohydrate-binding protein [Bacillota bacterium]